MDPTRRGPGRPRTKSADSITADTLHDAPEDRQERIELPVEEEASHTGMSAEAVARYRKAVQSGSFTRRLPAREMPGFMLRFVNDEVGRVHQFTEMGWDFVTNEEQGFAGASSDAGDKYSVVVGTSSAGKELRAYLLKIPQEWYDEFKRIEREHVTQVEKQIKSGQVNRKDGDNRYIPNAGIKITQSS